MDVLDQAEVDALLSAVDSGDVDNPARDHKIFSRKARGIEDLEVKPYDFKRPERVSKDQMRAIENLHEAFARNFGAALSGFLRTIVEVKVATCDQMTYSEFIASLPNPTSFNLLEAEPLEGNICLEVSPLIIYPVIDRLLGGTNHELFIPQRALTAIEIRLISKIIDRAMGALTEAWEGVKELKFQVTGMESNPQLVQIVPPNEVVIVVGFELKMSARAGTMNLCMPYNVIEPIMDDLSAQNWFSTGKTDDAEGLSAKIANQLASAPLTVSGLLAETTITISDLVNLSVGDILTTDTKATAPLILCIEDEKKFYAHVGQHKGARALRIISPITPPKKH